MDTNEASNVKKSFKEWGEMFSTLCDIYSIEPVTWVDDESSVLYKFVTFVDLDETTVHEIMLGKIPCSREEVIAIYCRAVATLRTEVKWKYLMRETMNHMYATRVVCRFSMFPVTKKFEKIDMLEFFSAIDFEGIEGPQDYYLKRMCKHTSNRLRDHNWCSCQLVKVVDGELKNVVIAAEYFNCVGTFGGEVKIESVPIAKPSYVNKSDAEVYTTGNKDYVQDTYGNRVSDLYYIIHDIVGCDKKVVAPNDGMGAAYQACKRLGVECISTDPNEEMVKHAITLGNKVEIEGSRVTVANNDGVVLISHSEQFDPILEFCLERGRQVVVYETGFIFEGMSKLHHHGQGVYSNISTGTLLVQLYRSKWKVKKNNLSSVSMFVTENPVIAVDDAAMLQTVSHALAQIPEVKISTTSVAVREVCKSASPPIAYNSAPGVPCLYKKQTNLSAPLYFSIFLNKTHKSDHEIVAQDYWYFGLESDDYITIRGKQWGRSSRSLVPQVVGMSVVQYVEGKSIDPVPVGGPPGMYYWKWKKKYQGGEYPLRVGTFYVTGCQIRDMKYMTENYVKFYCACRRDPEATECKCEYYHVGTDKLKMKVKNDIPIHTIDMFSSRLSLMFRAYEVGYRNMEGVNWCSIPQSKAYCPTHKSKK